MNNLLLAEVFVRFYFHCCKWIISILVHHLSIKQIEIEYRKIIRLQWHWDTFYYRQLRLHDRVFTLNIIRRQQMSINSLWEFIFGYEIDKITDKHFTIFRKQPNTLTFWETKSNKFSIFRAYWCAFYQQQYLRSGTQSNSISNIIIIIIRGNT